MLPRPSERKHRMHEQKGLQITAFLNLMVVLVPFLLLTAVFARMAVIELTLPVESKSKQASQAEREVSAEKLNLIVSIWEDEINVLNDGVSLGIFKLDEKGTYNFDGISKFLLRLKQQYPGEKSATVLSRPSIPYKTLVETIDAVREGFPEVSLGEL